MGRSKGQIAVEFLVYAGLFMIIAIAVYVLVSFTERGEIGIRESQLASAFGYKFAYSPTLAFKGGEGFVYDISFPSQLDNRPYTVSFICMEEAGLRSCTSHLSWEGTYQKYEYVYSIAPANYQKGEDPDFGSSDCLEEVPGSFYGHYGLILNSTGSTRLIFRNVGFEGGNPYPKIEIYCEVA
ncbi:MAG: hypothetical protein QXH30_02465 [Candidatus Bilamarchaeaceae archaeon]